MSSHQHTQPAHTEAGHGTLKDYVIGFVLSVILTVIPFWLVMADVLDSKTATVGWILGLGLVQMLVHMVYFLHMNPRSEGGWIVIAMVFTVITIAIAFVGSMWVMSHLEDNMMPHIHDKEYVPPSASDIRR
ncbi:cytochrome o ubiquinol oxidase operon protein cyoD [Lampropedia hyalina DSM 16112]|jgi:cytochrome o ubiquinol oxidase operon protein cyoD|uniref:Cytochrome bo(3) ubiquinol oxidase subunit 4 n=1 Tax=Lampropedia hyalina DSM 16112 TaxID=1122156 RepID=A0A1M5DFY7_9BURK|nr:cytochrome o ubiquinol oxidase subunit IV [Lampropedia hyalina]SHF65880.1 cytochrome o ubiquinol oxidase operon protein cyoD [Lampropedia hyalina DSM 16112]